MSSPMGTGSNMSPMSMKLDRSPLSNKFNASGKPQFSLNLKLTEEEPFTPITPKILQEDKPFIACNDQSINQNITFTEISNSVLQSLSFHRRNLSINSGIPIENIV